MLVAKKEVINLLPLIDRCEFILKKITMEHLIIKCSYGILDRSIAMKELNNELYGSTQLQCHWIDCAFTSFIKSFIFSLGSSMLCSTSLRNKHSQYTVTYIDIYISKYLNLFYLVKLKHVLHSMNQSIFLCDS